MRALDLAIIAIFLVGTPLLGIALGGKQRTSTDYFVGNRQVPWWAVTFSVVATETSTLTVISVPTVAYLGNFTYLQLAIGYLLGRILVAFVLLPRYYAGELVSAYGFLGNRFGNGLRATASVTFLVTRLLADGVRLFATAIPAKIVLAGLGMDVSYWVVIAAIALFAVGYAYLGGIRAVIWVDVVQLGSYLLGAAAAVVVLAGKLPDGWLAGAFHDGKFQFFDFSPDSLTNPYAFGTAVVGGALFAMASHGADQLMVQRLLACRTLRDSQKAVIASGGVVFVQFALFLLVGAMLWSFYRGAGPDALGLAASDELFPKFIVEQLPSGLSGLLIAGILAAAMSTISSSLNSLSTSTVSDIYQHVTRRRPTDDVVLRRAKLWTLVWAGVFVLFASMFTSTEQPVVEVGLSIAGYTYGALLGAFFLGILVNRARQADAVVAFGCTVAVSAAFVLGIEFTVDGESASLAFPWYVPLGVLVTLLVGGLLSLRHSSPDPKAARPRRQEVS